jgi:hypothetical protein
MQIRVLCVAGGLLSALLSCVASAQDVDVPNNLTMRNSTETQGNILKGGVPFLHNFGTNNTFLGSKTGNMKTFGLGANTAIGAFALYRNTFGFYNTASGAEALSGNTSGSQNTATGVAALQSNTTGDLNTATGFGALEHNTTGIDNTATGTDALANDTTGLLNTAVGCGALIRNITGSKNTALGFNADVSVGNLTNATVIGANAVVDASNKIRLGNGAVTVVETSGVMVAQMFIPTSDRNQKENEQPVDGEEVLNKLHELSLTSWNFIGQDPKQSRHYGPMAQDFFAAFGNDGAGTIGTPTSFSTTDLDGILMIAAQALEKRTVEWEKLAMKQSKEMGALRAENADLKARLDALERRLARAE